MISGPVKKLRRSRYLILNTSLKTCQSRQMFNCSADAVTRTFAVARGKKMPFCH